MQVIFLQEYRGWFFKRDPEGDTATASGRGILGADHNVFTQQSMGYGDPFPVIVSGGGHLAVSDPHTNVTVNPKTHDSFKHNA